MPQKEYVPRGYTETTCRNENRVRLRSNCQLPFEFTLEVLRPNLFRTTFTSEEHPVPPHPSAPRQASLSGNLLRPVTSLAKCRSIEVGDVLMNLEWTESPVVSLSLKGLQEPLHQDLPLRSYVADGSGVAHYTKYARKTLHCGLGEKTAPMDLSNRSFVMSATDCFGYDVYRTDPMYKHIPLLITASRDGCVGIFSTSHSRGSWSVGSEMDGLWGHFKVYRQDYGGLEEYLIVGRTLHEVVRTYADIVGYPKLVPRWAFGYLAGGMKYSMLDEPRACDALIEFAEKLKQHDIPCSGFQMSSGYTVAELPPKTRNVFTWNRHRFPDPEGFIKQYHDAGIRLIMNVKPYLLANHPEYQKLASAGAMFREPSGNAPAVVRLWSAGGGESGEGSHIDFTSEAGFRWWYEGIKELKRIGVDCIWNDNNEFTIPDDDWQCALDAKSVGLLPRRTPRNIGLWGRSLHTELMAKASHDALVDSEPEKRPFVLTRSATAGTMRYAASTWSGDNVTSWEGMKGANALGLNAGISLLQCSGHDIGGFEGPQPSPELLVRWVQLGIYSPRFAINCFKTSPDNNSVGDVIEPWMYPEVTPIIRKAIRRRYELMPYIYSLSLESHMTASPPQRWIGWGYEHDMEVWSPKLLSGETQYWLGDTLLIGGVFEAGENIADMYLPKPAMNEEDFGYLNLNTPYQQLNAGQWVQIKSDWKQSIPVLAKIGGALPVGKSTQTRSCAESLTSPNMTEDDYRAVEIFPPPGTSRGKTFSNTWYEDDGVSADPKITTFCTSYSCDEAGIIFKFEKSGPFDPAWDDLCIILPVGDGRRVVGDGGRVVTFLEKDSQGRSTFKWTRASSKI